MVIMIPMMLSFTTNPNPNPIATAKTSNTIRLSVIFFFDNVIPPNFVHPS